MQALSNYISKAKRDIGFTVVMTHSTKPKWCDYYMRFYTKHKVIWTISW